MLTLRRPQPCNNCRKHRRKCVKPGYDSPCVRCARLQHPCTSSSESESEEVIEDDLLDGSNDVNAMWDQVQQMQEIMKQLELSMKQAQRVRSGYLIQPSTPPDDDTDTDYDSDSVGLLRSGDHSDYRWEISVVDGRFQLETPIQSFHEMLAYGRAAIRYLSPFQDLFHDTNLVFELSQAKDSVLALLFDMIAKSSKAITAPPAALLPNQRTLLESPRVVVDTLVDLYFACQNKTIPFVNEATYMAHYAKLRDPTTCAVTMGICVVVTSSVCKHVPFAPAERRRLAEYFFEICENRLYDIFDEPDHRLETVITIHLVSSFLRNTLKTAKTRKWSTISKLICDDLSQTAQFKSQDERILFSRHHVVSALISQFLDYLIDKSDSDCPPKIVDEIAPIALQPMSSECGITIELLEIMDYVVKLSTTPCMRHSFRQICRMHMGKPGEFSLELILQCEEATIKWWNGLPAKLRLCEDPHASVETLEPLINGMKKEGPLVLFGVYQAMHVSAVGCLIQPKATSGNSDILSILQERLLSSALRSSHLARATIKRLELLETVCHANNELLFSVIDTLRLLVMSTNPKYVSAGQKALRECISELDQAHFMDDHRIPLSASPLNSSLGSASAFQFYSHYPLPRYAMIYDILINTVKVRNFPET